MVFILLLQLFREREKVCVPVYACVETRDELSIFLSQYLSPQMQPFQQGLLASKSPGTTASISMARGEEDTFHPGPGDLKLGPWTSVASALSTEPSPQPVILVQKPLI